MVKWHVNSKGVPGICRAEKGKCPFGGEENHFDTEAEADASAFSASSKEFGLFAITNPNKKKLSRWQKKDIAKLIKQESKTSAAGFEHECYASAHLAEELGFEKIGIIKSDGSIVHVSMETTKLSDSNENETEEKINTSTEILKKHYEQMGVQISNKDTLVRVIYFSDDSSKGVLIQSGGSNVLDATIIKNGKVTDMIEIKELGKGAQLSSVSIKTNDDGLILESSLENQNKYIREKIGGMNVKVSEGTNHVVNFGTRKRNRLIPLLQFVQQYKRKGATSLLYTSDDKKVVNKISLEGKNSEVIDRLEENKISAEIMIRNNMTKKKPNDREIERFRKDNDIFKEGVNPNSETFTLMDVKKEKISKSSGKVRVGPMVINSVDYNTYKLNMDIEIKKEDLKMFTPNLTGKIKSAQKEEDLK